MTESVDKRRQNAVALAYGAGERAPTVVAKGTGLVALISDGEPLKLNVAEAPTFVDPQAAIAWSSGVRSDLKTDVQAKSLIGMGSGESVQLAMSGEGWVLVQPSEGRQVVAAR